MKTQFGKTLIACALLSCALSCATVNVVNAKPQMQRGPVMKTLPQA